MKAWHCSMIDGVEEREEAERKRLVQKEEERLCVICHDKPKSVLLLPCRHLYVCPDRSARSAACPLCRVGINSRINAFM